MKHCVWSGSEDESYLYWERIFPDPVSQEREKFRSAGWWWYSRREGRAGSDRRHDHQVRSRSPHKSLCCNHSSVHRDYQSLADTSTSTLLTIEGIGQHMFSSRESLGRALYSPDRISSY